MLPYLNVLCVRSEKPFYTENKNQFNRDVLLQAAAMSIRSLRVNSKSCLQRCRSNTAENPSRQTPNIVIVVK